MPDDYTSNSQTTGAVTVGGSARGDIESNGDRDWFAVTLEANRTYRFDLEGSRTSYGTLRDPYLRGLYDSDGVLISGTTNNNGGYSYNSRVTFTADSAGIYYVSASAGPSRSPEGTYTLSVTDVTDGVPDDYTTGTGTTGAVTVGGSARGDIESNGDRDWFAVELEENKTYQFDLKGSPTRDGSLRDPYLRGLYDSDGVLISGTTNDDYGSDTNSRVTFTADAAGTHYVSAGAYRDREGSYTLSVTDVTVGEDDYTAGTDTTGAVTVGGSVTGEVEFNGDRDWFAVTLEANKTYQFDLEGSPTGAGTLRDPYLRGLYDSDGALISGTTNNNGGLGDNSRVTFTADTAGIYYVSAGAYRDREGTYMLSVTDVTDYTAGTDTTGAVTVGGSARGDIESNGDYDWFAVMLDANKTYQFDLEGSRTGAGTLRDPYLRGLYDSDGVLISGTTNNNGGLGYNSRVTFTTDTAGTYYVSAGANGDHREGTYTLSVTDITVGVSDDYTAGTDTTGAVTVGGSATGEVEFSGDRDWFAVTLEENKTYQFDLEGSRTGDGSTLRDPYLRGLYDSDGALISGTTNNNGGLGDNSRVTFTADAAGIYYVSAGANEDGEGTYTLSVTDVTNSVSDDYTAGTGATGAVTVGGSATGGVEFSGDQDWFAVTLEENKTYQFDLEGSPTGAGTLRDPYLRGLYDSEGALISGTTNDDHGSGRNSRVTFTADATGIYYVSAGAYRDREGTYTLSVTDITVGVSDDYTAGTDTSGAVTVGGSATGDIEFNGDRDWFAVTLEANKTYQFDLEGSRTGDGSTLRDPYLRGLYDSDGALISGTTNNNGGLGDNSRGTFTADTAGIYYVSAGAYRDGEGSYTLSVTDVTVGDDYTAGTDTTGEVTVGGSARGDIESNGDRDWFAVTLEANKTYQFDLEGSPTRDGSLRDPYLRGLYDSEGALISGTTNDDHGSYNSRVTFTADTAGIYYVSAGAYKDREGTYALSVEEVI